MNTILSREQFTSFVSKFRTRAQAKDLQPIDMMFYNIVRGLPAARGFSPISNTRKLAAGQQPNECFIQTKRELNYRLLNNNNFIIHRYGDMFLPEIAKAMSEELMK